MKTKLQILSDEERHQVHERSVKLLSCTGIRVDTDHGCRYLENAGAKVDWNNHRVLFPQVLVETCLQSAPAHFKLGGRRDGWAYEVNSGDCTLVADGGAVFTLDGQTHKKRPAIFEDWLSATLLIDAIEDIGVYWAMVQPTFAERSLGDAVAYFRYTFRYFSRHVQDSITTSEITRWMLQVLQTTFGGKDEVRRLHPFSFLLCPSSPLVIEASYTDAYLETIGWDIPAVVMPMPMMGSTAPGSLITTLVQANCEALAMMCLVESAAPGTPFIYAPVPAIMDPRSGQYASGAVENALLSAAVTEMARYYHLPVEGNTGGTSSLFPGIQASYERAFDWALPVLSWPDLLVGPGLVGDATILSLEQLLIDVDVFRRCKRLGQGINSETDRWLENVIEEVGPGGNFLGELSTRKAFRSGELYTGRVNPRRLPADTEAGSDPLMLDQLRDEVSRLLAGHQSLPIDETIERELVMIEQRARALQT
jgi:trimethylamine---corrinoid protein Co-methyltransferase